VAGQGELQLSLLEAERRANEAAPALKIGEARVAEALATRVGAGIRLPSNPRLSIDGRAGWQGEGRGESGFASSLDLVFEVADAAGARLAEADERTRLAGAELIVARLQARLQAVEAYVGSKLAELRIGYAREAMH
jgi:hypothetical protein